MQWTRTGVRRKDMLLALHRALVLTGGEGEKEGGREGGREGGSERERGREGGKERWRRSQCGHFPLFVQACLNGTQHSQ